MSSFLNIQGRGTIALPPDVRRRYGLDEPGAQVELIEREDGILELRPCRPMQVVPLNGEDSAAVAAAVVDPPAINERLRQAMGALQDNARG